MKDDNDFGAVIYRYSRAQAMADGVLVDVSAVAREAGFSISVAITAAAWADCVAWTDIDSARQMHQDEKGRLWDVLRMAELAAKTGQGSRLAFEMHRVPRGGRYTVPRRIKLHMTIGPGDAGEPAITVMLPSED